MPELPLPRFMRRQRPTINASNNRSNNSGVSRKKVARKGEKEAAQAMTAAHKKVLHIDGTGRRSIQPAPPELFEEKV